MEGENGGVRAVAVFLLFAEVFLQLVGRGGPLFVSLSFSRPPLRPSIHPPSGLCNNGVKHLRLPGNYGRAKTAGQRGADELRHPAISPCISISPSLPQMTSVLSVWRAPGDRRECRGMKRQLSDLTGTPAAADEDTKTVLIVAFFGRFLA